MQTQTLFWGFIFLGIGGIIILVRAGSSAG